MSLMLGQARGQAGDALAELRHPSHPSVQGLCCGGMGDLFVVQGGFGALELGAQRGRLLLQAFQYLAALLQLRVETLQRTGTPGLGLLVQAAGAPAAQVLPRTADCNLSTDNGPLPSV